MTNRCFFQFLYVMKNNLCVNEIKDAICICIILMLTHFLIIVIIETYMRVTTPMEYTVKRKHIKTLLEEKIHSNFVNTNTE